jgi:hypothetical protein
MIRRVEIHPYHIGLIPMDIRKHCFLKKATDPFWRER